MTAPNAKIVIAGMPAFGHVNPTLPIVRELVRRGEHVIYYDTEEFRAPIEKAGATFRAYPARVLTATDIAEATQTGDATKVVSKILQATESLLPRLLDELASEKPDAIAFDSNAVWGRMAATILNRPKISLMTTFLFNTAQLKQVTMRELFYMFWPVLPSIPKVVSARSRVIRRFGKSAFPPPPTLPMRGDLNIVFVPRELQPEDPRIDDTFHFVGPTLDLESHSGNFPFDELGTEPIIYISLGTLHLGSIDFWKQCFEAFSAMPAQFVLSAGKYTNIDELGPIPKNFTVRQFVPQIEILGRASIFITHGGMNSVLEGLYQGVPLLLIPQQIEQLLTSLNVAANGAGVVLREHVAGKRITARQLRAALKNIMAESRFREAARKMQTSLRATGGYRKAADEIQAFVARSRSKNAA